MNGETETVQNFIGKARKAMEYVLDPGSFVENVIDGPFPEADLAPGAVVGTAAVAGRTVTVIASDTACNPRFPVVRAGIIGLEEGYKMAAAVYRSLAADREKPRGEKRPLVLVVDTPGNAPGKIEEIFGMNCSTGAYQLALAQARQEGHPVLAIIVGRAISGAFLCHGLQADRILSLSGKFGTTIHVMPLSGIAGITGIDIERLRELSRSNPVFASGAEFFHRLGGVEELIEDPGELRAAADRHIGEIRMLNGAGRSGELGPMGRGELGAERGGRVLRKKVLEIMEEQVAALEDGLLA
ncbi:MAG: biotin-independent malonate decarboxylase subunit gamma [Treponema sp.]|nr:biotin-independent malonate decarboxylase subunit gamma [Treponema sp.]